MRIAMIGLGRMGANIARRLMRGGHEIVAFDRNPPAVEMLAGEGATAAASLEEVAAKLESPRIFWVMLPAGPPTESTIETLMGLASPGDVIIDGGNSFYKDDVRRAKELAEKGIHYVDVGTSGGVWGLERGYCMMIGGDKETVDLLDPIFATLAPGMGDIVRTPGRVEDKADPRAEQLLGPVVPSADHVAEQIAAERAADAAERGLRNRLATGFRIGGAGAGGDERGQCGADEHLGLHKTSPFYVCDNPVSAAIVPPPH